MMRCCLSVAAAMWCVMGASGCTKAGYLSTQIDGTRFIVPRDHVVRGSIPWLPVSQSETLRFLVNPTAHLRDLQMVSIESLSATCAYAESAAYKVLSLRCAAAKRGSDQPIVKTDEPLQRITVSGSTQWTYRQPSGGGEELASCSGTPDGRDGLCLSLGSYRHLVYSLRFSESDVQKLRAIHEQVKALLRRWEH